MELEYHQILEAKFAEFCGMPNTVACSSGTSALHLALEALDLPPGSQVMVPEFTTVCCARAVTMAGLKPVFVDCGPDLLIDPGQLIHKINSKVRAIMPVHVYGRRCNMDAILEFAILRGLAVIEDLAEAHGVFPHPRTDAACWSFYRNKIISGEEGGMIAFKNASEAHKAKMLRSVGARAANDCYHMPRGFNARMSNVHASIILKSLDRYSDNQWKRREVERWYNQYIPQEWRRPMRDAVWVYDLGIPNIDLDQIIPRLRQQDVEARYGFKPMSMQPEYRGGAFRHLNAYQASREILYLPVYPYMEENDVKLICNKLLAIVSPSPAPLAMPTHVARSASDASLPSKDGAEGRSTIAPTLLEGGKEAS